MAFEEMQIANPRLEDSELKKYISRWKGQYKKCGLESLGSSVKEKGALFLSIHLSVYPFPSRTGNANPTG